MGTVIKLKDFNYNKPPGLLCPIIYCNGQVPIDLTTYSINVRLAERLLGVRQNRRTMRIESLFLEIIESLPDNAVIQDFDVMFNPDYKVDVLKILMATCKKKAFDVIWPGTYEDGKLYYSEDGFLDYKSFVIDDYDVTCIV